MRIDVIHANSSAVEPLENIFKKLDSTISVVNHINEEMLFEVERVGQVNSRALRMFAKEAIEAEDSKTDGIIVACSVFCGYIDLMKPFVDSPIIAVDGPAIEKAAEKGGKIGILATTAASAPACQKKLETIARARGYKLSYEHGIVIEAMNVLKSGDFKTHDRLIIEKAKELENMGCDVLLLSQVTMARAKESMPEAMKQITLDTPYWGASKLIELIKENNS